MSSGESTFVGAERHALVDRLVAIVDHVAGHGTPHLVTLEAGSGWGKTRLVHELYRQLAARQQAPAYWPPSIVDALPDDQGASRDGLRKRIFPLEVTPPAGAVPDWFWWGITATAHRGGATVQALATDLAQVDRHAAGLERAWRARASTHQRAARLVGGDEVADLGAAIRDEGIGKAAELVLGSAVPGLGLIMWAGGMLWRQRHRWGARDDEATTIDAAGAEREDLVGHLARSVGDLAAVHLPVIIVVEDLHEADSSLVDLLVRILTETSGPTLIVGTTWPGMLDRPDLPPHRLVTATSRSRRTRLRQPGDLPDLAVGELHRLAAELVPEARPEDLDLLCGRFTVPLTLEVACSVRSIRDALAAHDLRAEDVDALPRDVEGLYLEVWRQLPDDLREYLMVAALATPGMAGGIFDEPQWEADTVVAALSTLPWLDEEVDRIQSSLLADETAYAWVRRVDDWLRRFHEPAQMDVVAQATEDAWGRRRRGQYYAALADQLHPGVDDLDVTRRRWQSQMLVTLAAEGFIEWSAAVDAGLDLLVAEAADLPDVASQRTVVALVESVPGFRQDSSRRGRRRREVHGRALAVCGRIDAAIEVLGELLDERLAAVGDDENDPDDLVGLFTTAGVQARLLSEVDEHDRAVGMAASALDGLRAALGPGDRRTIWAMEDLGTIVDAAGDHARAIELYEQVLGDLTDHEAGHRARVATVRSRLAHAHALRGDLPLAAMSAQTAVRDLLDEYGEDHPDVLQAREVLADIYLQGGEVRAARDLLEVVVDGRSRILGDDHPASRAGRAALAGCPPRTGDEAADGGTRTADLHVGDLLILVMGQNTEGDEIHTYLAASHDGRDTLHRALAEGDVVRPGDHGTVLVDGRGAPPLQVVARMGLPDELLYFHRRHPPSDAPTVRFLLLGPNPSGATRYSVLDLPEDRVPALRDEIESGRVVRPFEWGDVVAAGDGVPSAERVASFGPIDVMLHLRPRPDAGNAPA